MTKQTGKFKFYLGSSELEKILENKYTYFFFCIKKKGRSVIIFLLFL